MHCLRSVWLGAVQPSHHAISQSCSSKHICPHNHPAITINLSPQWAAGMARCSACRYDTLGWEWPNREINDQLSQQMTHGSHRSAIMAARLYGSAKPDSQNSHGCTGWATWTAIVEGHTRSILNIYLLYKIQCTAFVHWGGLLVMWTQAEQSNQVTNASIHTAAKLFLQTHTKASKARVVAALWDRHQG